MRNIIIIFYVYFQLVVLKVFIIPEAQTTNLRQQSSLLSLIAKDHENGNGSGKWQNEILVQCKAVMQVIFLEFVNDYRMS